MKFFKFYFIYQLIIKKIFIVLSKLNQLLVDCLFEFLEFLKIHKLFCY